MTNPKPNIQPDDDGHESEIEFYTIGEPGLPPVPPEVAQTRTMFLLDRDVVDYYKSTGKGWQARLNADLRKNIR